MPMSNEASGQDQHSSNGELFLPLGTVNHNSIAKLNVVPSKPYVADN
jgi:hypothetical protein